MYQYVEVQLDNIITPKRLPLESIKTKEGIKDPESVRVYFRELGYNVGQYVKFL